MYLPVTEKRKGNQKSDLPPDLRRAPRLPSQNPTGPANRQIRNRKRKTRESTPTKTFFFWNKHRIFSPPSHEPDHIDRSMRIDDKREPNPPYPSRVLCTLVHPSVRLPDAAGWPISKPPATTPRGYNPVPTASADLILLASPPDEPQQIKRVTRPRQARKKGKESSKRKFRVQDINQSKHP